MVHINHADLVFLLGAGASVDAGLPTSTEMVRKLEQELERERKNNSLRLLHYLRGGIQFYKGCQGESPETDIDIESLVWTVERLANRQKDMLLPFVGNWHELLKEFELNDAILKELDMSSAVPLPMLGGFAEYIRNKLSDWLDVENRNLDYLSPFANLIDTLKKPLHVFTLNYDLCIESFLSNKRIIRGFDENCWRLDLFAETFDVDIFLYKLHGSLDWFRTKEGQVFEKNSVPESIDIGNEPELIFGTFNKLQSLDPFLALLNKFSNLVREARLIVIIGYSFRDDYINAILRNAMQGDSQKFIVAVSPDVEKQFFGNFDKDEIFKSRSDLIGKRTSDFFNSELEVVINKYLGEEEKPF